MMNDIELSSLDDPQNRVLRYDRHHASFARNGFALVPFFTPAEIDQLKAFYWEVAHHDGDEGFTVDYMRADRSTMATIREFMDPIWERHFPEVFIDRRPILTTFIVKHPSEHSNMYLHEDRSFTDERTVRAASMWIPLVDIGADNPNGGLHVIPGSHQLATGPSGTGTPDHLRPHEPTLREHLVPVEATAGTAIIYDSRMLHASPPNVSDHPREAVACAVVPRDAPLLHFIATGRRRRVGYAVDDEFFITDHPASIGEKLPQHSDPAVVLDDDTQLTAEMVEEVVGCPPSQPTIPIADDVRSRCQPTETSAVAAGMCAAVPVAAASAVDLDFDTAAALDAGGFAPSAQWTVGTPAVVESNRLAESVRDPWVEALGSSASSPDGPQQSFVVVLDEGNRLELHLDARRLHNYRVTTIDAPRLSAGALIGSAPVELDLEVAVAFESATMTLWNDGPGAAVFEISLRIASRKARRLAALVPIAPLLGVPAVITPASST